MRFISRVVTLAALTLSILTSPSGAWAQTVAVSLDKAAVAKALSQSAGQRNLLASPFGCYAKEADRVLQNLSSIARIPGVTVQSSGSQVTFWCPYNGSPNCVRDCQAVKAKVDAVLQKCQMGSCMSVSCQLTPG
jgi:hypothetical protein